LNHYNNVLRLFILTIVLISTMAYSADELLKVDATTEKKIAMYRNLLQQAPKSERARDGLASIAVSIYLLIEQAEELGDLKEVARLDSFITGNLPDTAWRVENRANKKQLNALVSAGLMYRRGVLVSKNRTKSCGFYAAAASQSSPYAHYRLALCFVSLNADKTVFHMTAAANQNHAIAQEYLARICLSNKDWKCMMRWANSAADKGRASALSLVAWAYEQGYGVDKDSSLARELYTRAALGGDLMAQNNLGQLYEEGSAVDKDLTKALHYYRSAAQLGLVQAQYNLGRLYLYGIGVKKNKHKALKWLDKSKRQNSIEATKLLAQHGGDG